MSAQQAVAFANKNFEPESAAVGFALETLGFAEWKTGAVEDGEKAMLHGIQILRTKLAPADPRVAGALLALSCALPAHALGQKPFVSFDRADTSRALHVHRNTLGYRIGRLFVGSRGGIAAVDQGDGPMKGIAEWPDSIVSSALFQLRTTT